MSTQKRDPSDTEMLDWLTEMTEALQKVYIDPVGWIYLTRDGIREAMKEHNAL